MADREGVVQEGRGCGYVGMVGEEVGCVESVGSLEGCQVWLCKVGKKGWTYVFWVPDLWNCVGDFSLDEGFGVIVHPVETRYALCVCGC